MLGHRCYGRGVSAFAVCLLWSLSEAMEVPTGQQIFSYDPVPFPEKADNPALAKPIAVGDAAEEGDTLNLRVGLGAFSDPVDVYFCIWMPSVDPSASYLLLRNGGFQPLVQGLEAWKSNITGPVEETVFKDIPIALLPPGEYVLFLLVTPAGRLDTFSLWTTHFCASSHVTRSVAGLITDLKTGNAVAGAEITLRVDLNGDSIFSTPDILVEYTQEVFVSRTDARGAFLVPRVPVGDMAGRAYPVLVSASASGYSDARRTMSLLDETAVSLEMIPSSKILDDRPDDGFHADLTGQIAPARLISESRNVPGEDSVLVSISIETEDIPAGISGLTADVAYGDPNEVQTAVPGQFRAEMAGEEDILLDSAVYADIVLYDQEGRKILTKQSLDARGTGDCATRAATVKILVPRSSYRALLDMVPDSDDRIEIPMWWFDDTAHVWRLDEQYGWLEDAWGGLIGRDAFSDIRLGDFEGSVYAVSRVHHFTPWNVDVPVGSTFIAGSITDSNGDLPEAGGAIGYEIVYGNGNGGTSGTTDPAGNLSAPAPSSGTADSWEESFKGVSVAKFAHKLSAHTDSVLNADVESRRRFLTTLRDIERAGVFPKVSSSAYGQDIPDSLQWLIDNAGNPDTLYQSVLNNYMNQLKTHRGGLVGEVGNIALGNARDDLISRIPVFGKVWGWITHPVVAIGGGEIEANRIDSLVQQIMLQVRLLADGDPASQKRLSGQVDALSQIIPRNISPKTQTVDSLKLEIDAGLARLLNQEEYAHWAYRSKEGIRAGSDWQSASQPRMNRGGRSRASIRIPLGAGQYLYPGVSDNGVDWQDIGIPVLQASPNGTPERPVRWIGTVQIDLARQATGRLVYDTGAPAQETKIISRSGGEAVTDEHGAFSIDLTKIEDVLFVPGQCEHHVPGGNPDIDLGDIVIPTGSPMLGEIVIAPPVPVAGGGQVTFAVIAEDPEGDPLTFAWRLTRWDHDGYDCLEMGSSQEFSVSHLLPGRYRSEVVVSDETHETIAEKYFTVETGPPIITGFDVPASVSRGARIEVAVTAEDPQGLPLTYQWVNASTESGGFSDPTSPRTVWYAPVTADVASAHIKMVVSNGVHSSTQSFEVLIGDENMLPVFTYLGATRTAGQCPMEVTFDCIADDPDGGVEAYLWDFDGDGANDDQTPFCRASHVYMTEGSCIPRVTAVDNRGGESAGEFSALSVSCDAADGELTLTCTPSSGPAGATVVFSGRNWPPGSALEISFDNDVVVPHVTADAWGNFSASWIVPSGTSGGIKHVVANVIGSVTVWTDTQFIVE